MAGNAPPAHLPTQRLLGFSLAAVTTPEFLSVVLRWCAEADRALTIGYLNAAQVNLAFAQAQFARNLKRLDALYADGQAVVWAARRQAHAAGPRVPERINAGDFTLELMQGLAARRLKLALIGGRPGEHAQPGEAQRAANRFEAWAPGLQIVLIRHGYLRDDELDELARALDESAADLVLLGMGAPRQEARALELATRGRPRVYWCVGALFEYYAGTRGRAPRLLRRLGLEWLVRLLLEPRRLWKRYLLGNPLFIYRVWRNRPPAVD